MLNIKKFTFNPLQSNCYVVSDETAECVVIDDGAYTAAEQQVVIDFIRDNHLLPTHHLLTHAHPDHCFGAASIAATFSLLPEVHVADQPLIAAMNDQCEYILHEPLREAFPAVRHYFTEQETYVVGSHTLRILLTPGHSPGSVCFLCDAEQVLFAGDTLFFGGIGRTDFIGGSMLHIMQSLRILCQLDDVVAVYPGHGGNTTIGYECATNPFIER